MNLDHHLHHDQKQREATLMLHGTAARDHVSSPERRSLSDAHAKCYQQSYYEREQHTARELQKLRDSFGALKLEKDKEIAFLRDQLAAYTSMSKSSMRVAGAGTMMLPSHISVGVQTASGSSPMRTPTVHSIA